MAEAEKAMHSRAEFSFAKRLVLGWSVLLVALHLVAYFLPSSLTWGLNYFRFLPPWILLVYTLVSTSLLLHYWRGKPFLPNVLTALSVRRPYAFLAIVIIV